MNQNHLLQCHLRVRTCLCTFDIEALPPNSEDDRDQSTTQNELFLPLFFTSSITSFLFLTFVSCQTGMFSSFSHFPLLFLQSHLFLICVALTTYKDSRIIPHKTVKFQRIVSVSDFCFPCRLCEGCLVVRSGHGPQAEVAQGLDLNLSWNSEENIWKGRKKSNGTK